MLAALLSVDTPPLTLVPATQAGVQDKRGRFREVYCAVLQAREREIPDCQPCKDALTRVGASRQGPGDPSTSALQATLIAAWFPASGTNASRTGCSHRDRASTSAIRIRHGAAQGRCTVGLRTQARQIRDAIMAMPANAGAPRLVLVGYSKGAPDILEAMVAYPEIRHRSRR